MKKYCLLIIILIKAITINLLAQTPIETLKKDLAPFFSDKVYTSLTEALKNPEKVIQLDLGGQKLKTLPAEIGQFKNLQKLTLYDNELKNLPTEITQLKRLKWLDVYNNQISELSNDFANLDSLEYLDLGWNHFKTIPLVVFSLKNLKYLYFYGNKLKNVPNEITQLQKLEVLRLGRGLVFFGGGNQLRTLPENFGELRNLRELYLPDNQLHSLPTSFNKLKKLRWLDVSNNRFTKIPNEIQNLDSLQYLSIWNRGFSAQSRREVSQKMPQTKFDFHSDYEGILWGLQAGFQQGKYSVAELGIVRGFKKDILFFGLGASAEINLNAKMTGAKISAFVNGLTIFSAGLHGVYYFTPTKNSLAIRPELGIGWGLWSINYGYNILFAKGMENVNKHLVSLRLVIPISPFFSPFK